MELAIIDQNTLTCMGLEMILKKELPDAVVRTFRDFGSFIDDTPDMYSYYFISSQLYVLYNAFFLPRKAHTIIMMSGALNHSIPPGNKILNVDHSPEKMASELRRYFFGTKKNKKHTSPPDDNDLTPREIEVLTLVCRGLINKEIADKLNISLTTVITHRKNITLKLGIKSISGLTMYAVMNGYISPDRI
jgi:DNA-binding CsgD family transcriptional regulator